jgi:predicted nucleotidyltransferase
MFTEPDRARILQSLIARAEADPDISGAVLLGSSATGGGDRWSDLDLAVTVRAPVADVAERWTAELGAVHYWDFVVGDGAFIRVFLMSDGLEIDLGFYAEGVLVQRGPWRPLFGEFVESEAWKSAPTDPRLNIGMAWHHLLHVRNCVERGRLWQAEQWVALSRGHIITLACMRFGLPGAYAKGAHELPAEATEGLEATLVRSLDVAELRRALIATVEAYVRELRHHDPDLADRLYPILSDRP